MNKRIHDIATKARNDFVNSMSHPEEYTGIYDELMEKFAELIVRECAGIARKLQAEDQGDDIGIVIEEHFGVDETLSTASDSIGHGLADEVVEKRP